MKGCTVVHDQSGKLSYQQKLVYQRTTCLPPRYNWQVQTVKREVASASHKFICKHIHVRSAVRFAKPSRASIISYLNIRV